MYHFRNNYWIFCLFTFIYSCASSLDDQSVKLNQVQVIGSHNSYKQPFDEGLWLQFEKLDSAAAYHLQYAHPSLSEQLALGLHNLEIDVFADADGGRYSQPKGLKFSGQTSAYDSLNMLQPGFKVLHIPEIDFRSSCASFKECLSELKAWSEAHPDHLPVFITLEAKDGVPSQKYGLEITPSEPFTAEVFDRLDQELITYLGRNHLIIPEDVKGSNESLEQAILTNGWSTLDNCLRKCLFVLDDSGRKRDIYLQGHPSLNGRILFVNADPGRPEAATLILNDPHDVQISDLVKKGYIVRTRADSNTKEARNNDYTTCEAAFASGAQIITTDYYLPSTFFSSSYQVLFPSGQYVRPNPIAL